MKALIALFCFLFVVSPYSISSHSLEGIHSETYSITITITGIRSTKGSIILKFYDDDVRYPETNGFRLVKLSKSDLKDESITVTYYGFTSKYMGVSLLDDENGNSKLDLGLLLPKEGHAFSDYHHTAIRKPVYEDFRFLLTSDKVVSMKMKYY